MYLGSLELLPGLWTLALKDFLTIHIDCCQLSAPILQQAEQWVRMVQQESTETLAARSGFKSQSHHWLSMRLWKDSSASPSLSLLMPKNRSKSVCFVFLRIFTQQSVVSLLCCIWEKPALTFSPFLRDLEKSSEMRTEWVLLFVMVLLFMATWWPLVTFIKKNSGNSNGRFKRWTERETRHSRWWDWTASEKFGSVGKG